MTMDFDPKKFQEYFEQAAKSNLKAWEAQTKYFEELVRRNTTVFSDLADARVNSLQEISGAKNFTEAFETNVSFEEVLRNKLQELFEENTRAWEALQAELKSLHSSDNELIGQIQKVSEEFVESAKKAAVNLFPEAPVSAPSTKPAAKKPAAKPAAKAAPASKPAPRKAAPRTKKPSA